MTCVWRPRSFSAWRRPVFAAWLKLLSFRPPTSVTRPTVLALPGEGDVPAVPPVPPPPHAAATMAARTRYARTRFMRAYLLTTGWGVASRPGAPAPAPKPGNSGDSRSVLGEDAPQHVAEEDDIQAPAEHQRRERQGVLACSHAELGVDEKTREQREDSGQDAERPALRGRSEVPRGQQHADRHRNGRLEHHRAGDVAERDHVLAVARPDQAVRRLRQLGRERREDERHEQRAEAHRVREVLDEVGEEPRTHNDRGESEDGLRAHQPQWRRGPLEIRPAEPLDERRERELLERLLLLQFLFDVLGAPSGRAQDKEEIEEIRRQEDPPDDALEEMKLGRGNRERERKGVHDEEKGQVALRVSGVDMD